MHTLSSWRTHSLVGEAHVKKATKIYIQCTRDVNKVGEEESSDSHFMIKRQTALTWAVVCLRNG